MSTMIEEVYVAFGDILWNSRLYRGSGGETRAACGHCQADLGPVLSVSGSVCGACGGVVHAIRYALGSDWDNLTPQTFSRAALDRAEAEIRMSFEMLSAAARHRTAGENLLVSDHGIPGAYPLPPATWDPWADPLSDNAWAEQNRKINDLLAGRTKA